MENFAIKINGLGKKYTVGKQMDGSLRGTLANLLKSSGANGENFWALQDVSFEVKKGEVLGIIGKNGAGKSTLLKILSQITKPTEGRIEINGRVASLLEVGTGFHPELTGRENVYLNGTILGMSRKEVKKKFDEIVEFSGVQKFINTPVKHYSSGMYVRLAFAVAAHLEPEILIIDEVLAVGDSEFQNKCLGKMKDVAGYGRTVLFVSHNLAAVESLCDKAILLDQGQLLNLGNTKKVIKAYHKLIKKKLILDSKEKHENEFIKVNSFKITPSTGEFITVTSGINFELEFESKIENATVDATFELRSINDVIIFHCGTFIDESNSSKKGRYAVKGIIQPNTLNFGNYQFDLIFGQNSTYLLLKCPNILSFEIENTADNNGHKLLPGVLKPDLQLKTEFLG